MPDKGMFTELMEANSQDRQKQEPVPQPPPKQRSTSFASLLPGGLEDLSEVGYNSKSYRFTDGEKKWINRFCLRVSELLDHRISHNTLFRVLLRLADQEWSSNPNHNRLRDLLSKLKG